MATIPSTMAAQPLRKMGERRDETPPAVEVIEEQTVEGRRIVLITRNRT